MFLEIEHTLSLAYEAFIRESFLELRMQPKTTADQTLQSFVLAVGPPTKIARYRDWNGNVVHHFTIVHFHNRIQVVTRAAVTTHGTAPALDAVTDARPFPDPPYPLLDFLGFDGPVRLSPALRKFAHSVAASPAAPLGAQVLACGRHIREHFAYRRKVTRVQPSDGRAMPGSSSTRPRAAGSRSTPPTTGRSTAGTWWWPTDGIMMMCPPTGASFAAMPPRPWTPRCAHRNRPPSTSPLSMRRWVKSWQTPAPRVRKSSVVES